jgi:hypothetical protein
MEFSKDERMAAPSAPSVTPGARSASARLNQECLCITLDRDALSQALAREVGDRDFYATFIRTRPHLFSNTPVFISDCETNEMLGIVRAISGYGRKLFEAVTWRRRLRRPASA